MVPVKSPVLKMRRVADSLPILQPGEQVLIGSLNVSVKKFFFHAGT